MTKKGLSGQPQQHGRILPHRPQHGQVVKMLIGFAENVDALVFQLTKMSHRLDPLVWSMRSAGHSRAHRLLSQLLKLSCRRPLFERSTCQWDA